MKRRLTVASAMLGLLGAAATTLSGVAPAQAWPWERPARLFEIHNDTAHTVRWLSFRPVTDPGPDEDLLVDAELPPQRWVEAPLKADGGCLYQLRARLPAGRSVRAVDINVCTTRRFKLSDGEMQRPRVGGPAPAAAPPGASVEPAGPPPAPDYSAGPVPLSRGLPICPGDPRCKKRR